MDGHADRQVRAEIDLLHELFLVAFQHFSARVLVFPGFLFRLCVFRCFLFRLCLLRRHSGCLCGGWPVSDRPSHTVWVTQVNVHTHGDGLEVPRPWFVVATKDVPAAIGDEMVRLRRASSARDIEDDWYRAICMAHIQTTVKVSVPVPLECQVSSQDAGTPMSMTEGTRDIRVRLPGEEFIPVAREAQFYPPRRLFLPPPLGVLGYLLLKGVGLFNLRALEDRPCREEAIRMDRATRHP